MADPTPTHVSSPPAYAAAPRRSGLLYAVAGIVALAAVAAVAIFMLGGRSPAPVVVTPDARGGDAQKSADAAKATLDAASKSVLNPAPETPPVAEPPAAVVAAGSASAPPPASMPRTEARPAAPRPAPATTPAPAPAPKASSAPPKVDSPAPAASASPPAQVASADVWTQMRDEMARCSSSSVIPRIQCERRIRARYCDGHWGTVPDCPTGNRRS